MRRFPLQWVAMSAFLLASAFGMLDRQLLAALAPTIKTEFHLSNLQYGSIVSAFALAYAWTAPLTGLFIDRVGLNIGATVAVVFWSFAATATGFTQSLRGLVACRFLLGAGESGGVSAPGKAGAQYFDPAELGLGAVIGGTAVTIGSVAAPLLAAAIAPRYGWRAVFLIVGGLGLLWVPLWWFTSRRIPPRFEKSAPPATPMRDLLRDSRLWGVAMAYGLVTVGQSLWTNWTTIYFVQERHLTQLQANRQFAWFTPVFGILGALYGGMLAFRLIRRGMSGLAARKRVCYWTGPLVLVTAAIPFLTSNLLAAVAIGLSYLSCVSISNNIHVMPVDLWGARRAAFTNSIAACALSLLQAVVAPAIGRVADVFGFKMVCIAIPIFPLLGLLVLRLLVPAHAEKLVAVPALSGD